ncbi:MAG: hypothetical protein NUV31_00800 [Dehalococcoidales bacterium]|nr:hypothetical protein [Dehalococcoidales bacterium]
MKKLIIPLVSLLILTLVIAGCGGGLFLRTIPRHKHLQPQNMVEL